MPVVDIPITDLIINSANDRHGELADEVTAITWLFDQKESHMKNLAKDITDQRQVFELPLVCPEGDRFIVYDGNRRVTCLKLIAFPNLAPTLKLQKFFSNLYQEWRGAPLNIVTCQVEEERDRIDDILFRRHTGSQNGVGQSTWDDRMQRNFIVRTGKQAKYDVAEQVEDYLSKYNLLPNDRQIPRSTMNRLFSSEQYRNRAGISIVDGKLYFTHDQEVTTKALEKISQDLTSRNVVLGDLWDAPKKKAYLNQLAVEGLLPNAHDVLQEPIIAKKLKVPIEKKKTESKPKEVKTAIVKKQSRTTLIPQVDYGILWQAATQKHKSIWDELQFSLLLSKHSNAISVVFRVLLEISIDHAISVLKIETYPNDKLANKIKKVTDYFQVQDILTKKDSLEIKKFQNGEALMSADTLHRYVHSSYFVASPEHLISMWDCLAKFIVSCINASTPPPPATTPH
ncbi:hypothetical protein SAMN04488518_101352 [Pseudovibrio ascidiaceicola]|uniref:ParB/Sulfiredoxin domain-containing protein n=1 Tax=Pseudovibrio ascidiaceicola TaxID=285279 RepID=A0A1I3VHV5_9HYPH|nr:hypothetical protein [Pseudovibrio ascidiaceicola]SFJ93817.1 hypothetical protein SAMN04488518_101352 [Pseudovibrio ascidiaceicola]